MKIRKNHQLYPFLIVVGQEFRHNGIRYEVTKADFGHKEAEPIDMPIMVWKGRTRY